AAARTRGSWTYLSHHRAVGDRDRDRLGGAVLSTIPRWRLRQQADRRAGDPRRPVWLLRTARSCDVLARKSRASSRHRARHRALARALGPLSAALGGDDMADVRDRTDQAPALH